jgi:adenylate cyclase
MIIVHYEVYVLEGRGWMLHARFPRTERETAVNEAKELEQTLNVRVKVVRETYYTDTNAFDEAEIYLSGSKGAKSPPAKSSTKSPPKSAATAAPRASSGTAPRSAPAARTGSTGKAPPPRPRPSARSDEEAAKARQIVARLLAVTAVSLAVALLAIKLTPEVIILLWKMGFSVSVSPEIYGQVLIAVFGLSFLMTAVPLGMRFLPRKARVPTFGRPAFAWGGSRPRAATPVTDPALKKSLDQLADKALREQNAAAPAETEGDTGLPSLDDDLPMIAPGPEATLPEIRPDAAATPGNEPPAYDRSAAAELEKKPENSQSAEAQLPAIKKFLNGAIEATRTAKVSMDAYNKFALHLYMAGAVESLCDFRKLSGAGKSTLLNAALEALGTKGDMASNFYEKLPEYRREGRYGDVITAGRNAMGDYLLGDEAGAHLGLTNVFREWNTKSTDKKGQMMTVVFTDMVGSTDLTQERGDAAAQEIVRRHNLIVRSALAQFHGKEVKHTGDGIMASFLSASEAVEATILIQRQVHQHNARQPGQALHLRIGLNAGAPIQEEDDLFGSTVQLSARVCAATDSDEILCTDSVKNLSTDKPGLVFRHIGDKSLKGFKEPIPLYQVPWQ